MYRRKIFIYVDTENISTQKWRDAIPLLEQGDFLYIPISPNSGGSLNLQDISLLYNNKAKFEFEQIPGGTKNAMDFVITARVAGNVKTDPDAVHLILSEDTGYTPLMSIFPDTLVLVCNDWFDFLQNHMRTVRGVNSGSNIDEIHRTGTSQLLEA